MNVVKFPGVHIVIEFSKIAFYLFGVPIYKYAICIVVAMLVGLIICSINFIRNRYDIESMLECYIFTIIAGIIGARIYFVIFNFGIYKNNLLSVLYIRDGGLAIYGGLIFGAISIIVYCKSKKKSILDFFDFIVPSIAIAQCIGRWGNFFNVEAYGYETENFFRMGIEKSGRYLEVHPVFLYESILMFVVFIILELMIKNRKFKGQVLLTYCILYSAIRFMLEGLRIDSLMMLNIRVSKLLSATIFMISFVILVKQCRNMSYEKLSK